MLIDVVFAVVALIADPGGDWGICFSGRAIRALNELWSKQR